MHKRRWLLNVIVISLCLISATALQAQEKSIGRVTTTVGTDENRIIIPLVDPLEVGDEVTVEFTRLSGDLIPIVALRNQSKADRIVYRYRDFNLDGQLDETVYQLNNEAGPGNYALEIADDPDVDPTTGDYLVIYTIRRDGQIINEAEHIVADEFETPVIMIAAPTSDESVVLSGDIDDETFRVDYLISLNAGEPLQFRVTAESSDLIPMVGISPAEKEDFTVQDAVDGVVSLIYPGPDDLDFKGGRYVLAVTRKDVDQGKSSGQFRLEIALAEESEETASETPPG